MPLHDFTAFLADYSQQQKYYFKFFDKYKLRKTNKCDKLNEQIHQISPCIVRQDEGAVLCGGNISSSFSTDTNYENKQMQ